MTDLYVSFEETRVDQRSSEFISYSNFFCCSRWNIAVRSIGERGPLSLWVLFSFQVALGRKTGVFWYVGRWEFDLGFLFDRMIGRWTVGRKGIDEILLVGLFDAGG